MDVRRAGDRFRTVAPGLDSRHSFSYGPHYDPDNLGFGVLMALNEDRLSPGAGYDRHAHRGIDIVTWVLTGTLEHEHWIDGNRAGESPAGAPAVHQERLTAGMAQVLRTGTGVHHAEHATGDDGAHYVQMWLTSATPAPGPGYDRRDFTAALAEAATAGSGFTTVASGRAAPSADSVLFLTQPGAELWAARLPAGAEVDLPTGPLVHVFIASGVVNVDGTQLAAGDALRVQDRTATVRTTLEPSEVLVWTLPSP
jgi:redox-sensitive bicupin YhaK (pirin superfamily)